LPADIRLSIRQVAVHRSEDAADQPEPPTQTV
jgi:glycerol-3-phosphate O-acyltransferase